MLDKLFMQILDMSLQASIVILVVMAVRLLLKRAPKIFSYALWSVVLLRLLCPFSIEAPVSVVPSIESVSESYTLQDQPISPISAGMAAYQAVGDALNGGLGVQHIYTTELQENGNPKVVTASWNEVWILFGQYVWLMGIAGMVIYSAVGYCKLRRRLTGASWMRDNIYLADHIDSPFVLGSVRPKIYLPSALGESEQRYIIAHEQQHIRRLDHMVKLIAYVALVLHWFNPLVWIAYLLFCKDMEMSCDEAVIRKLGEHIRADYSASLLNLATGRRSIGITPLAFGEGDTKGRIKNLSKWKKPLIWVSVVALVLCVAAAVCLLTDPPESGESPVKKIVNQSGYTIVRQMTKQVTLSLSTEDLPQSIYSEEGCVFDDGAITAYNDGMTKIYLKGARYSNEGTDYLYFYFEFAYDLPKESGQLLYPLEIDQEGYSYSPAVADGVLRNGDQNFAGAVKFRGQDSDERIWFYVSADALKQMDGAFEFDILINEITYLKNGSIGEMFSGFPGSESFGINRMTTASATEESKLELEVSVPKTDLSKPGQVLADEIAAQWKHFDDMSQLSQLASSHLPGVVYIDTNTWSECEKAIGFSVANPLEQVQWIEKTGYYGSESVVPDMPVTHVRATAHATESSNRQLSRIDVQAGYQCGQVRITLTATVCHNNGTFTTGGITHGYATYTQEHPYTGSGIPVVVVTTKIANNLGYYNDLWYEQEAFWVDGNVFYTLRVVGNQENLEEVRTALENLLTEL